MALDLIAQQAARLLLAPDPVPQLLAQRLQLEHPPGSPVQALPFSQLAFAHAWVLLQVFTIWASQLV